MKLAEYLAESRKKFIEISQFETKDNIVKLLTKKELCLSFRDGF